MNEKCFSCNILLSDQILLFIASCLYFLRYWSICLLQLFVNLAMTSQILKSSHFATWPKNKDVNLKISWEGKELLRWNKYFLSLFKGFQSPKIVSDLRVFLQRNHNYAILKHLRRKMALNILSTSINIKDQAIWIWAGLMSVIKNHIEHICD